MTKKKAIIIASILVVLCFGAAGTMKEDCDHSFVTEITVAATETKEGVRTSTCTKCGAVVTSSIPRLSAGLKQKGVKDVVYTNDDVKQLDGEIGDPNTHDNASGAGKTFGTNENKHDSLTETKEKEEKSKDKAKQKEMASRDAVDPETAEKLKEAIAYITDQYNEGSKAAELAGRPKVPASRKFIFNQVVLGACNYIKGRNLVLDQNSHILFTVTDEFLELTAACDPERPGNSAVDLC